MGEIGTGLRDRSEIAPDWGRSWRRGGEDVAMGGRARGAQRRLPEARLKTACDRSGERVGPRAHAVLAATELDANLAL